MPTHPGPWQPSPGPLVYTGNPHGSRFQVYDPRTSGLFPLGGPDPTFADLCEPTPPAAGTVATTMEVSTSLPDIQELAVEFNVAPTLVALLSSWSPPLPWPANAVDWEWDFSAAPAGDWQPAANYITGLFAHLHLLDTGTFGTNADVTVDVVPADPSTLTYQASGQPVAQGAIPGASLTPLVASQAVPVASTTADIDTTTIAPTYAHNIYVNTGHPETRIDPWLRLVLAFDNMRTHVPPAGADGYRRFESAISASPQTIDVHWTPPQWRFIYAGAAPLRQYPRDDALGGTPRQGHQSRSVQASAREGWAGTYR